MLIVSSLDEVVPSNKSLPERAKHYPKSKISKEMTVDTERQTEVQTNGSAKRPKERDIQLSVTAMTRKPME